jgi:hypothetical protein
MEKYRDVLILAEEIFDKSHRPAAYNEDLDQLSKWAVKTYKDLTPIGYAALGLALGIALERVGGEE